MYDNAEIRFIPRQSYYQIWDQVTGQGHETTYAQIIAEELGIPAENIQVEEGDTDTAHMDLEQSDKKYANRGAAQLWLPELRIRLRK